MEELTVKAEEYATKKTNEVISNAIAQAYADGYREGYKDCEKKNPIDLRGNKTEFVDLGLPSGTMWAADYEREGEEIMYLPYDKASKLSIPTEEQWKELVEYCKWKYKPNSLFAKRYFVCIGPNGNYIHFYYAGIVQDGERPEDFNYARLWIKDQSMENLKDVAYIELNNNSPYKFELKKTFMGYRCPVMQVCNK